VPYTDRAIIDGGNGVANTAAEPGSDDVQAVPVGTPAPAGTIVVLPGPDGLLATQPSGDDFASVGQKLLAGRNGVVEPQVVRGAANDDIQVVPLGEAVDPDTIVITAGLNSVIDTEPMGDDRIRAAHATLVASDPIGRDTDADGLFDGREEFLGSNPNHR